MSLGGNPEYLSRFVWYVRHPITVTANRIKKLAIGRSRKTIGPFPDNRNAWRNAHSAPGPKMKAIK